MLINLKHELPVRCWQDRVFYFSLAMWLGWKILNFSMLAIPDGSLVNTCLHAILLLGLVASRIGFIRVDSDLVLFLLGLIIGLGAKVSTSSFLFIDLAILLYAGARFPFKRIAIIYCAVIGILVSAVVLSSLVGIVPNWEFSRGNQVRYGLGFLYSTFVSHYLFYFVLMYLYVRRDSIAPWEYGLILLVNIFVYWMTNSRNSFLLVCAAVAIAVGVRLIRGRASIPSWLLRASGQWSFLILVVLSLFSVVAFDPTNSTWSTLNRMLSNRLAQQQASMERYDITLFGNDIELNGNALTMTAEGPKDAAEIQPDGDGNYVDNSFLLTLLVRGVFAWVAIITAFTLAGREAVLSKDVLLCFILLLIAIHSTVDDLLLEVSRNGFLFMAWSASGKSLYRRVPVKSLGWLSREYEEGIHE